MVRRAFIYVVAMVLATSSLLALPSPTHALTRDNWTVQYTTTDGDGLQLTGGYFKGTKVFARVTLPFIKVT